MIFGVEIFLAILGFSALTTGQLKLGKNRVVHGTAARMLGVVALLPWPLCFCIGFVIGFNMASRGYTQLPESVQWNLIAMEAAVVVVCACIVFGVGALLAGPPRRRADYYDYEQDLIRAGLPTRPAERSLPDGAFQGATPLRTMALFNYPPPLPADEVAPAKPRSGMSVGTIALLVAGLGFGPVLVVLLNNNSPSASPAPAAQVRIRVHGNADPAARVHATGDPNRSWAHLEVADWPEQVPAAVDERLLKPGARLYLSDLPEFAWKPGHAGWRFGKAGNLGSPEQPAGVILYGGKRSARGLSMHPPNSGYTRVCYYLGRRAQFMSARVCLSEDDKSAKPNPTRFVVMGDGQVIWRSESIRDFGWSSWFTTLDVSRVNVLELRTYVENGNCQGSHAVWIDPYVVVRK